MLQVNTSYNIESSIESRIRAERQRQGKSLSYIAKRLGITVSGYSLKELGSRPITIKELEQIAKALDKDPKYFL